MIVNSGTQAIVPTVKPGSGHLEWAEISAIISQLTAGEQYAPVFTAGGGVASLVGSFAATWTNDIVTGKRMVRVLGLFGWAVTLPGATVTIKMTLPPAALPPNFAAPQDAIGSAVLQGIMAATDGASEVRATVGDFQVECDVTSNLASVPVVVDFTYSYVVP